MDTQNEENLKELFERFVDADQADSSAEDIRKGEEILRRYPAPEPRRELIAGIKAETARALLRRKASAFKRMAYRAAAVAAVFIILAAVGVKMFESESGAAISIIPKAIWESVDIAADDADLAVLAAEIEEMEGEALALQLGENGGNGEGDLTELEMEYIEINGTFWKG